MARRQRNQNNEDRTPDNPAEAVAIAAEEEATDETLAAERENDEQASENTGNDADALIDDSGDGASTAEVGAANSARLAAGEEPVVPENVESADEVSQPEAERRRFEEELARVNAYFAPAEEGVGEDTWAVKQSHVPRVVDGRVIGPDNVSADVESADVERGQH